MRSIGDSSPKFLLGLLSQFINFGTAKVLFKPIEEPNAIPLSLHPGILWKGQPPAWIVKLVMSPRYAEPRQIGVKGTSSKDRNGAMMHRPDSWSTCCS